LRVTGIVNDDEVLAASFAGATADEDIGESFGNVGGNSAVMVDESLTSAVPSRRQKFSVSSAKTR
jgi:hypothetical protein